MNTLTLNWTYIDDIGQAFARGAITVTSMNGNKVRQSVLADAAYDIVTNIVGHNFENTMVSIVDRIAHITADNLGPEYFIIFNLVGE